MLRVLVLLVLFVTTTAWGQGVEPGITASQLDAAVESVSANLAADDPQRASLLKFYADTRAALQNYQQQEALRDGFVLARANASAEARLILKELASTQLSPVQDDAVMQRVSLQELEQMIQVDKAEMSAKKGQLADIRKAIADMPGRPAVIRQRVAELVATLAQLESQLGVMNKANKSGSEDEASLWLAQAQRASASAEKEALDEELLSSPMRMELLKAELDETSYSVGTLQKRLQVLEQQAGDLRQGEAAQAQAEAELVLAGTQGKHELVQQLADENAELTAVFSERSDAIERVRQQETAIRGRAEQLETDLKSIEQKLEILGMSTAVGAILREQQAQLPSRRESRKGLSAVTADISASSLRQVELEDERRQLRDQSAYVALLLRPLPKQSAELIVDDLKDLVGTRRELMRQAVDLENTYALALGDLDFSLRRYTVVVDHYNGFISERLLWIPSRETFSLFRGSGFQDQMTEIFSPQRWLRVLQAIPGEMMMQPLVSVAILLVLILVYLGPRLSRQLVETGRQVGYARADLFSSTLYALALSVLLSIKWPMLLLTVSWLFEMQEAESELATALYIASMHTAMYFVGLEFLRIILIPKGLVEMHFRWPTKRTSGIRRRIMKLEQTFLPSAFLVGFTLNLYPRDVGGPLGELGVIAVLISIAHFFRRLPNFVQGKMDMMLSDGASRETSFWGQLIRKALYWVPVMATISVFFGYTFTAIEFALLLVETVVLFALMLMFHELGLRWLRLTRRRMTFKVRQEQLKAKNAHDDGEISLEDELLENDPNLLNDEGTKLLNVLTLLGGLLGIALIWAEVFPALRILDSVSLWHQSGIVDGREVPVPVTLGDLLSAMAMLVLGWVALRRIPGLLEILLRQNTQIRPASAYAITRVMQYVATTILVIAVMGALGGSWSSMQWAVAALSLGIGFGLQEIVANFISGLIILFEQPIRLGDTITVGEVSGTVTKIQMRATTVRDFDRRELLVPNKEFITSQLLNWSLSDQVTRWLLQVGVAYGSDMDKAMEIVRDTAMHHPLILTDPAPMVTFDEFGDNSLLISLRFFVDQLDQRLIAASELRLEINRRFNEAGIVVAFPQRDIHFDSSEPLEIKMVGQGVTD